jgi:hypothetical protein
VSESRQLQNLTTSVEALECGPQGLDARAASEALSGLADALNLRTGLPDSASRKVRQAADELASHAAASASMTAIHDDLTVALQALLAQPGSVEYRGAVGQLGRALDAMSAAPQTADGCRNALVAFRAATDAVFAGLHGEPPFAENDLDALESEPLATMQAGIEPARAALIALGKAGWQHARGDAAQALRLFAAMLRAADCAERLTGKISDLRFQAERLTRSDALSFGQTRWIKQGLSAALDGLDALDAGDSVAARVQAAPVPGAPVRLTHAARAAVAGIDAEHLLGLQRTSIQDAFRATLDAFAIAANSAPTCQK